MFPLRLIELGDEAERLRAKRVSRPSTLHDEAEGLRRSDFLGELHGQHFERPALRWKPEDVMKPPALSLGQRRFVFR